MVRRHRPSMVGLMKSAKSEQVVPLVVGITILYHLSYNALMYGFLPDEDGSGECFATGGSTYCQELEVFRSWQEDDSALMTRTKLDTIEQEHLDLIEFGKQVASANDSVDTIHATTVRQTSTEASSQETSAAFTDSQHAAKLESHLSQLAPTVDEPLLSGTILESPQATVDVASTPVAFLDAKRTQLHWSSVVAWSKSANAFLASKGLSVVSRAQVRHLHWASATPKVACVTPILGDRHARARMMYFVDNFRLQDYEGARQLVLVYHYLDESAARLAQAYADGNYIKAVAAQGNGTFPSATALRYGAWSVDADIIAHWDFDEWHDPSQLSMQIRAMAFASRPACTVGSKVGPSLLVGEQSWMKLHWRPYTQEDDDAQVFPQDDIVELDMKASSSLGSLVSDIGDDKPSEDNQFSLIDGQQDWNISGCIDLDSSSKIDPISHNLKETIGVNMGEEMSKAFHKLLARRHDITLKLQLRCLQNTSERNSEKHEDNRKQVIQMLRTRAELDKHIATTAALFHSPGE